MQGNEYIGFFPGDPGGCIRNGCTAETFVDLCLELSKVVRKNNPRCRSRSARGASHSPAGVCRSGPGKPAAGRAVDARLPRQIARVPAGTFTSINQGFSRDCDPNLERRRRTAICQEAAQTHPVLTWDYSVTEGEGTVSPRCRVRRMFAARREPSWRGLLFGRYLLHDDTAAQLPEPSSAAPRRFGTRPGARRRAGRLRPVHLRRASAAIGPLLEEFEVIPDWGYYAPFPYSPQRLQRA